MPPLLEIEDLSMPMLGAGGGLVDDGTGNTCGGGGEGSMYEEPHNICGGGGGGTSRDGVVADTSGLEEKIKIRRAVG